MTEFESIVLKNLLKNSTYFSKCLGIIEPKYFKNIGNSELFKLIKNYYLTYKNIPNSTEIIASVKNVQNSEIRNSIIESSKEMQNIELASTDFLIDETVKWVKDSLYLEALMIGSDGLTKKDDSMKLKAQRILEEMHKVSVDSDLGLSFDDIEAMIAYYQERNIGIKTQHKEFNKRLGSGFLPGTLNLILSQSGGGKSLLMTDLISGMIKDKKNILLVSLEMKDKEIMKRVHANALNLPINSLIHLSKTEGEKKKMLEEDSNIQFVDKEQVIAAYNEVKASGTCGHFFVKDYPSGTFSALQLEALVESYKVEQNIEFDIIFVDYLGIAKSDLLSPSAGLYSYLKSIAEEFRGTASKLNLPIVSASQLNRSATGNTEADNSNVSDSLGSVMTADFLLFLLQTPEMKLNKEIIFKCTKNRYTGRTDTWMMNIDYEHMRFSDMVTENSVEHLAHIEAMKDSNKDDALDFGLNIVTADKIRKADDFATNEIKEIAKKDIEIVMNDSQVKKDPLSDSTEDLFKQLGIL